MASLLTSAYRTFFLQQIPKAKYLFTVCTGSELVAATGLLDGKRATTNKAAFKRVSAASPRVQWQPKARWVVDGNIWTSSGVTAGGDQAVAFLRELAGDEVAQKAANVIEMSARAQGDDPFAAIHGLV